LFFLLASGRGAGGGGASVAVRAPPAPGTASSTSSLRSFGFPRAAASRPGTPGATARLAPDQRRYAAGTRWARWLRRPRRGEEKHLAGPRVPAALRGWNTLSAGGGRRAGVEGRGRDSYVAR